MADFQHPLAPAPRGDRRSSDSGQQQLSKPKRTNIGVACSACKARKLKVPYLILYKKAKKLIV